MKLTKKNFTMTVSGTKNFQSVKLTEGFEVEVNDEFNELEFESMKSQLKDRLIKEVLAGITDFNKEREIDDAI